MRKAAIQISTAAALVLAACTETGSMEGGHGEAEGAKKTGESSKPAADSKSMKQDAPPSPKAILGAEVASMDGIAVHELKGSKAYPEAKLTLESPTEAKVEPGKVAFKFGVQGYELGAQTEAPAAQVLANSGKGQHIHAIVDNAPYYAKYEPDFELELDEGHHVLLAFLSRSFHESVKGTHVVKAFTVGKPEGKAPDLSAPHMFYSRPKGSYAGMGAKHLMLDFYLVNTTIGEGGNYVEATVGGKKFELRKWVPYVVTGLPMGEVTVRLRLLDKSGKLIPGPFNDVTRKVTLSES